MIPHTILLTGVNGQVGMALDRALMALQQSNPTCLFKVVKLNRAALDLTSPDAIRALVQSVKPSLIINPAAFTAVDRAESEAELAFAVNAIAPGVLAEEAAKLGAKIIHFSTDYVYDGNKEAAFVETDATQPLSIYGKSKLAGEEAIRLVGVDHLIFRTSWVYGPTGHNFMKTILRLGQTREHLTIVADQHGAPTSSQSIADAIVAIIQRWQHQQGVYHLVNQGETSWHGFAQAIVSEYQLQGKTPLLSLTPNAILPISTAQYPLPAPRPANSRLNTDKLQQDFGISLGVWQKALSQVINSLPSL